VCCKSPNSKKESMSKARFQRKISTFRQVRILGTSRTCCSVVYLRGHSAPRGLPQFPSAFYDPTSLTLARAVLWVKEFYEKKKKIRFFSCSFFSEIILRDDHFEPYTYNYKLYARVFLHTCVWSEKFLFSFQNTWNYTVSMSCGCIFKLFDFDCNGKICFAYPE